MKILKMLTLSVGLVAVFFFSGCLIEDVNQPAAINVGETFTTTITISDMNAEQNNAHKGVVAILVPEDWSFISGTYSTPMGFGNLELDPLVPPVWGDIDTVIQRPAGMKWINLLSDQGYLHTANVIYEATVNLQVGQTAGTFPIGYLVTVNTSDMLEFLNDQDIDQELSGADTSMNHMVTITGSSAVDEQIPGIPAEYNLSQNFPNPFNPSTSFTYSLKKSGDVKINVYDVSGKEVKSLVDGFRSAGNYVVNFNAGDMASGIYYYRITTNDFVQTNKMVLLK
ncbi:MAG: T9SS type A sorting domain-containing protein [Ignavibacteriaceae bacterium]